MENEVKELTKEEKQLKELQQYFSSLNRKQRREFLKKYGPKRMRIKALKGIR